MDDEGTHPRAPLRWLIKVLVFSTLVILNLKKFTNMKSTNSKKPTTRSRLKHAEPEEEVKSSFAEPTLPSSSDSDSDKGSDSDPEYSQSASTISHDLREAAANFARTYPEAFEVIRSESQDFTRLYSDIRRLRLMDQEPIKSISKDLLMEVFKFERRKARLEMA